MQAVELKPGIRAAASGMSSTWLVLSALTRAETDVPQAASIAGPAVRVGGDVISPWDRTVEASATRPRIELEVYMMN